MPWADPSRSVRWRPSPRRPASSTCSSSDHPMLTVVYLVRHGSVIGAETRRFIGHLDVPLSPLGERQFDAVAARLRGADLAAVYSSDLARARRSAEIVAARHDLIAVPRPALREFDMGQWE